MLPCDNNTVIVCLIRHRMTAYHCYHSDSTTVKVNLALIINHGSRLQYNIFETNSRLLGQIFRFENVLSTLVYKVIYCSEIFIATNKI